MTDLNQTLTNIRDSRRRHGYSYTEAGERMSQAILDHVLSLSGPSEHAEALLRYEFRRLSHRHRKFIYRERSDFLKFAANIRMFDIRMRIAAERSRDSAIAFIKLIDKIQKTNFELKA